MKLSSRVFALMACVTGATALVVAQAMPLNVKIGLWESTMSMDMGGAPPGMDTSKMTPEQQAQMAAMMRGRAASMPAVKTCLTKEKLAENRMTQERAGTTCKSTVVRATATMMDITQTCTGNEPSTSDLHIEAPTPTAMKMIVKPTSGRGAGMTLTLTQKWLQADCGDVK